MSVKIIKLDITYTNVLDEEMDVFMITSGSELVSKFDIIFDYIREKTTAEKLEEYLNHGIYKKFSTMGAPRVTTRELRFEIDSFLYRINRPDPNDPASSFIKSIYRDIKLNDIGI